jgi:ABC-type uncharacterized transport system permease subunit
LSRNLDSMLSRTRIITSGLIAATLAYVAPAQVPAAAPNSSAVEEVLQDVGMLDFGKGMTAKCDVSVWRTGGDQKQLVGEFAFQVKTERRNELHAVALKRAEQLFVALQYAAQDWLALGTTKTGAVYRLKGNPPRAHE